MGLVECLNVEWWNGWNGECGMWNVECGMGSGHAKELILNGMMPQIVRILPLYWPF